MHFLCNDTTQRKTNRTTARAFSPANGMSLAGVFGSARPEHTGSLLCPHWHQSAHARVEEAAILEGMKMKSETPESQAQLCPLLSNQEGMFSPRSEKASVPLGPNSQEELWAIAWEHLRTSPPGCFLP